MKRILFVTGNLGFGGAEKRIVDLSNGLCGKGFKVAVLVFLTEGRNGLRMKNLSPEVEIFSPTGNYKKTPLFTGICEVVKAVRKWKPDVLCGMHWKTKFMVAVVGKSLGNKVVMVECDSPLITLETEKHKSLKTLCKKSVYHLADIVIGVSEGVTREIENLYRLNGVRTIYNGIDVEGVKNRLIEEGDEPLHEYFSEGLPVLVAVGRLDEPKKGHKNLLQAFKIVSENTDARLIIVGDGDSKDELIRTAKSLGISRKVAMVGEAVPYAYMRHGDIFVLSSLYEGFPNVLLEAASLGLPIVSTDCNYGPNEIIENGENGLLVPVSNPERLADAILRLIKDKKLRGNLAMEAEKRSRCFSLDRMVADYEEVFLSI